MENILFHLILFTTLFGVCAGIQCHQCAMVGGDECEDYYNGPSNAEDFLGDCEPKDTHCVKFKTVIKIGDSGYINGVRKESVIVSRGCERAEGAPDGCYWTQAAGGIIIKCRCSTDGCNSATSIVSTTTMMLACLLAAVITVWCRT